MRFRSATLVATGCLLGSVLMLSSCSKNNQLANDMDGLWGWDAHSWQGSGSISGSSQENKGTWTLNSCKAENEMCEGEYFNETRGFTETFKWTIEDKGETFVLEADSDTMSIANQNGEWQFWSKSENKYILISTLCDDCPRTGQQTIVLNRR